MSESPANNFSSEEEQYVIPVEGSLGLLALGYRGVQAWRKVRDGHVSGADTKPEKDSGTQGDGNSEGGLGE